MMSTTAAEAVFRAGFALGSTDLLSRHLYGYSLSAYPFPQAFRLQGYLQGWLFPSSNPKKAFADFLDLQNLKQALAASQSNPLDQGQNPNGIS